MKKLLTLLTIAFLVTGCCFSQLPTQYAYVDENCTAVLPDFTGMVVVSDNCGIANILQIPAPGDPITVTTQVFIQAIDETGNERSMSFDVVLLDTIAPLMQINPDWVGYSTNEVMDMYKVFYGWVQDEGDKWNEVAAGQEVIIELPDTTLTYVQDSMKFFRLAIPILDYRMDEGYWANSRPDLTAMFK
jgi:hypothetical protein